MSNILTRSVGSEREQYFDQKCWEVRGSNTLTQGRRAQWVSDKAEELRNVTLI